MSTKSDLLAALAAIDSELAETERKLARLRAERLGADALFTRLGITNTASTPATAEAVPASEPTSALTDPRVGSSGNAKIVTEILAQHPEGVALASLAEMVEQGDLRLSYDQVRSAVTYLKRQGQADTVRRGVWRLVAPENAETPAATGVSGGDRSNTEGRSSHEEGGVLDGTVSHGDQGAHQARTLEHPDHLDGASMNGGT